MAHEILDYVLPHPSAEPNLTALSILIEGLSASDLANLERLGFTKEILENLVNPNNQQRPDPRMHIKWYEEELMQYEEYRTHKFLLVYVPPILIILGTIGNILSFLILFRPSMRRVSTYNYLAVLSVTDTLVLYIGLMRMWIGELTGYDVQDQSDWACKIINVMGYTVSDYSVWLIIAVTVERYIAVVLPMHAPTMCNRRRAFGVIVGILVLLFWINSHFFWTTKVQNQEVKGEIIPECDAGLGYKTLVVDVWPWVDAFIYSFLPFIVILILNSMIIRRVMLAKRERIGMTVSMGGGGGGQHDGRRTNNEMRLTIMLLTISFAFLITTLPMNAMLIATAFMNKGNDLHTLSRFVLIRTITELLMYVNHSMNFFLYCATGKKFRQQLCLLMCHSRIVGRREFTEWMSDHAHTAVTKTTNLKSSPNDTDSPNHAPASPYQSTRVGYRPVSTLAK